MRHPIQAEIGAEFFKKWRAWLRCNNPPGLANGLSEQQGMAAAIIRRNLNLIPVFRGTEWLGMVFPEI